MDSAQVEEPTPPADATRPESAQDTLLLEGMPEPVTLRLYRTPAEVPVPFSVYLPDAFEAQTRSTPDGAVVRFAADFANTGAAPGWIEVAFLPVGTTETEARDRLRALVEEGVEVRATERGPRFPWALDEITFTRREPDGTTIFGAAGVGRHAERFFLLTQRYPAEWADGFGPRAALLLETWRWGSGERLVAEDTTGN